VSDVYGIRVDDGDGVLGWMSEGGKVARSHVIYSEAQNLLYTLTWSDYGAQLYAFDPATGFVGSYANSVNTGHGFYDVGALEFDGKASSPADLTATSCATREPKMTASRTRSS
jgi:hypothetical protein